MLSFCKFLYSYKVCDYSLLGLLNFFVLQWSCFRLAIVEENDGTVVAWTMVGPWLPLTRWNWSNIFKRK